MCSCIVQTASVPQVQMSPTYSTCWAQVGAQKKVDCSGRGCGVGARAGTAARQRPMLDVPGTALRLAWRRTVRVSRWRVDSATTTGSNSRYAGAVGRRRRQTSYSYARTSGVYRSRGDCRGDLAPAADETEGGRPVHRTSRSQPTMRAARAACSAAIAIS